MRLKYLFDQPNINARQGRWFEFLSKFEFDIKHVKGKENKVENSLSKKSYVADIITCKSDF